MLEIDGAAGGGQLLRSAVSLAAVTDRAVRVENVRGSRSEPGLKHQHLAAVEAVAAACDAQVDGAELGSETVTFEPGPVSGGRVDVDIPTAGSVALVFDTVLPLAVELEEVLTVRAEGGTDVAWSPSSGYYRAVKLPLLARYGLVASLDVARHGFYPVGGGEATLALAPADLEAIGLAGRGERRGARVASVCSPDLAEADVAERQTEAAVERLQGAGYDVCAETVTVADAPSTGSAAVVRLDYERSLAGFDALGEPGRPAEDVGERAADAAIAFNRGPGAVDRHLADQLLPFLALAGGELAIPAVTDHVASHLDLLAAFGFEMERKDGPAGTLVRSPR